jgi:hypothetical protein
MKTPVSQTNKTYLKRWGDQTDIYNVGEEVRRKWNRKSLIIKVSYDAQKDITTIVLVRRPDVFG